MPRLKHDRRNSLNPIETTFKVDIYSFVPFSFSDLQDTNRHGFACIIDEYVYPAPIFGNSCDYAFGYDVICNIGLERQAGLPQCLDLLAGGTHFSFK